MHRQIYYVPRLVWKEKKYHTGSLLEEKTIEAHGDSHYIYVIEVNEDLPSRDSKGKYFMYLGHDEIQRYLRSDDLEYLKEQAQIHEEQYLVKCHKLELVPLDNNLEEIKKALNNVENKL